MVCMRSMYKRTSVTRRKCQCLSSAINSQSKAYALARAIADPAFIFIILLSKKPGEPDYNTDLLWVLLPYCGQSASPLANVSISVGEKSGCGIVLCPLSSAFIKRNFIVLILDHQLKWAQGLLWSSLSYAFWVRIAGNLRSLTDCCFSQYNTIKD